MLDHGVFWMCLALVAVAAGAGVFWFYRSKADGSPSSAVKDQAPESRPGSASDKVSGIDLEQRSRTDQALRRSRERIWGALKGLTGSKSSVEGAEWERIEEALLSADVGVATSHRFLELLKEKLVSRDPGVESTTSNLLVDIGKTLLGAQLHGAPVLGASSTSSPCVVSIVGVNGVGKTTTVGKLAHWYRVQGKTVLVGAADTFRAAAMEQLKVWAERAGAQYVAGRENGDPGAVVFDALTAAKARGVDVVLIDTAGRLHTKQNLMEELGRVHRVMEKVIPGAPHEIWLVLDGNLGQNSVRQAKEFSSILKLSGVIVTKLDGSAKGGALFAIASELGLPIRFLGLGEGTEDLVPFESEQFVQALVGTALD